MAQQDHRNSQSNDYEEQPHPTKEQQIAWLCQIIDREVEKPDDEIDHDLVMECSEFLNDLTFADKPYSDEEIEEKLKQLKGSSAEAEQKAQILSAPQTKKRNKPWLKAVAALAATFTVFFATFSVVAKTQGYGSAWEYVVINARRIIGLDPGEKIQEDGITITKPTGTATYATIEELVEKEDLHILYPTNLPDGIKLESILQTFQSENEYSLFFEFSDKSFTMRVTNQKTGTNGNSDNKTLHSINGIDFYVAELGNDVYHATCQYNNFKYTFQCNGYDTMTNLLNNMKGY